MQTRRKGGKRPGLLNVRGHLEHVQLVIECYEKYGKCPILDSEMAALRLFNRAILRKHDAQRAAGNRKDLYVGRP